ncbi:MAG TPA: hypothetical protein VGM26_13750 [Rhizomicrobium sp.]
MSHFNRRNVVKLAGSLPALAASQAHSAPVRVVAVVEGQAAPPVTWALDQLRQALVAKGGVLEIVPVDAVHSASLAILVVAPGSALASGFAPARIAADTPEQFRLALGTLSATPALLVAAHDTRGFVYGLLELAERVRFGGAVALHLKQDIEEAPANRVRSVARAFCSEIEDKPWFYSQEFWRGYLDMLVACRFNRFNFSLGIGYDFPRGVTDDYFHFPYPYLVTVPGFDVHAAPLADGEREHNLAMLQFIARETVARGLDFQLGLWTHAYQWTDSPNSTHHITGLTPETHGPYCRDALALILKACPEISGLTIRIHGESGVPEGSYPFWQTLFDAIPAAGRKIEIDMHAKGLNQVMIDMAAKTGMPVKAGAKYSAEHQSLGYHQADIRPVEIPRPGPATNAVFAVSEGDRRFTRYGYADLYREGQKYELLYRLWPGTQHHLLWGDPAQAAAFGRTSHFCNAAGFELMEPLTFKGREGSGHAGGRCAYADKTLDPGIDDWMKFATSYRLWGRLLYNPDAIPDAWRRDLSRRYGAAAPAAEEALSNASRIMPLLTSAHLPSASNHDLEYEMAMNMPIVDGVDIPYNDTPEPKVYGHVSPLDPQLFSTVADHADDLLAGRVNAKYSPVEVTAWLDAFVAASEKALIQARTKAGSNVDFRRLDEDTRIVNGMGRFYAAKLRAALLYEVWQKTRDPKAGALALAQYEKGRAAWAALAERASKVYVADISYGRVAKRRGDWADKLAGIDKDIAAMRTAIAAGGARTGEAAQAIAKATAPYKRPSVVCRHVAPDTFHAGTALPLSLTAGQGVSVRLFYRHVNHAERWRSVAMQQAGADFTATIPADYTDSPFPLQYYFELSRPDAAWLYPAFNATLSNQPYYAVWKRR